MLTPRVSTRSVGREMRPNPDQKRSENMVNFDLKKYRVVKNFGNYRAGEIVAFNGADAEKYADKLCDLTVIKPIVKETKEQTVIETKAAPVEEVKEVKKVKRTRKAKK